MKVRFIGQMPSKGYSGGRLMALTYATALSLGSDVEVEFVVDNKSEMEADFQPFSNVRFIYSDFRNLTEYSDTEVDITIIVPGLGNLPMHGEALRHAIENKSKIVLLNFETPNWFNSVSPVKRDPKLWLGWDLISEYADMILSISGESNKYASSYYTKAKKGCLFTYCYAPINSIYADSVKDIKRENEIFMLTRVDAHKGIHALMTLADQSLKGFTLRLVLGTGTLTQNKIIDLKRLYSKVGMDFVVDPPVMPGLKFFRMKSSSVLFFPTLFEGFGIPPLEAAYCNLPVACTDLPVLKEYGLNSFSYFSGSSNKSMITAIHRAISNLGSSNLALNKKHFDEIGEIVGGGKRLRTCLENCLA